MRDMIITSSLLIIAILFIRYIVKGKIHPLLQYSLWLLVVLKLLIPIPLWSSHVSVLNLLPQDIEQENGFDNAVNILQDMTGIGNASKTNEAGENNADVAIGAEMMSAIPDKALSGNMEGTGFSWSAFFAAVWFIGMIITGGYMLFYQIKWQRFLRNNRKPLSAENSGIANDLGITLPIYTVEGLPSPCLIGRNIYLTAEMAEDKKQLEHILAHEYCHYRQLDSLWVIIRCVLTAVYWFNPLVWTAAYLSKQDSELACDAAVIRMLGEDERISYGKTLINLSSGDYFKDNRIGVASMMSGGEKHMRERIFKIARRPRYIAAAAGVVIIMAATLIAVTFSGTRAEAEQQAEIEKEQEAVEAAQQAVIEKKQEAAKEEIGVKVQNEQQVEVEVKVQAEQQTELEAVKEEQEALAAVLQAEIDKKQEAAVEAAKEEAEAKAREQAQLQAELKAAKAEQEALVAEIQSKLDTTNYINPCPSYTRISDGFGKRVNPMTNEEIVHNGIDLAADKDADILAAADGTVYEAGYNADDGNYVIIHHGAGNYTHYNHCAEILVEEGESVIGGQKIAAVGSTGRSTGNHLCFKVEIDGEYVDPGLIFSRDGNS
ncbi:MAG: peptidoglycan DD-metalloendopeptidase family protein [Clostridiales bacterium]|nr:peptidoglycan DD-metalloendopeptidase family protein [Clostridiales bacterium]